MTKTTVFKIAAIGLFVLLFIFESADFKTKLVLCAAFMVGCQVFTHVKGRQTLQENARKRNAGPQSSNDFKLDCEHFFRKAI